MLVSGVQYWFSIFTYYTPFKVIIKLVPFPVLYSTVFIYLLFIYFVAEIVPALATGSPFQLAPVYFDMSSYFFHSSTLAWRIPWTEEPGGLQSMGSLGVGHNWVTSLWLFTFMHWRRKWQPTPVFLPGESQGRGEPGGLPSMGSHRVGYNWSDLAAAACRWGT